MDIFFVSMQIFNMIITALHDSTCSVMLPPTFPDKRMTRHRTYLSRPYPSIPTCVHQLVFLEPRYGQHHLAAELTLELLVGGRGFAAAGLPAAPPPPLHLHRHLTHRTETRRDRLEV